MTTTTQDLKENASATVTAATKTVGTAADLTKEKATAVGADVSERVKDAATMLRDGAAERIGATRDAISDSGEKLSETLRRAAEVPEAGSIQARVISAAADGLESVAGDLRNVSLSQMSSGVQSYAQRNPLVFAAGFAVAGFLVARLIRTPTAS